MVIMSPLFFLWCFWVVPGEQCAYITPKRVGSMQAGGCSYSSSFCPKVPADSCYYKSSVSDKFECTSSGTATWSRFKNNDCSGDSDDLSLFFLWCFWVVPGEQCAYITPKRVGSMQAGGCSYSSSFCPKVPADSCYYKSSVSDKFECTSSGTATWSRFKNNDCSGDSDDLSLFFLWCF
eukprot:336427_1